MNLEASATAALFEDTRLGPASRIVPAWVEEVLAGHSEQKDR